MSNKFSTYLNNHKRMSWLVSILFLIAVLAGFWGIGYLLSSYLVANGALTLAGWCLVGGTALTLPLTYWVTKGTGRRHGTGIGFLCLLVAEIIYGAFGLWGITFFSVYFLELMVINGLLSVAVATGERRTGLYVAHALVIGGAIANFWFMCLPVSIALGFCQVILLLFFGLKKPSE